LRIEGDSQYFKVIGSVAKGAMFVSDRVFSTYVVGFWNENGDFVLLTYDTEELEYNEKGVHAHMDAMCWFLSAISENVTRITYYFKSNPALKLIPNRI